MSSHKAKLSASSRSAVIIGTRGYPSYYGGFETAVRKLAPYLVSTGWDINVYGRKGSTRPDDPELDPRVGTIITRGFDAKSISTLSYGFTACLDAFWRKPDVALVMNVANGFFLPLLKIRRIRTIVNVDGIEWDRAKWGPLGKFVFKVGAWMTAKFADRLVFDAREIANRWHQDFGRDGAFIPYGGDAPGPLPVEEGLEHRGYVLLVARFVAENTIEEFIEAAPAISAELPIVIVGSSGYGGPLESRVQNLADTHSNVTWLGHLNDDQKLLSLWQHAAVYFHGHSVGGTNPTLVQAMATATPIVARDTPYNREVLPYGTSFFQPNPESIASKVLDLARDRSAQDRASHLNFERASLHYTWESVCAAYERELNLQYQKVQHESN